MLLALVVVLAWAGAAAPRSGAAVGHRQVAPPVVYTAPVEAPVVDRFRPPSSPYGPGNRGWEYATRPGTPVRAAGPGTVSFAGQVGGRLAITIAHPDGLRTSYSDLAAVLVRTGAVVAGGDVIGTSGTRLHVGVRRGEVYLDPAGILPEPPPASPGPVGPPVVRLRPVPR